MDDGTEMKNDIEAWQNTTELLSNEASGALNRRKAKDDGLKGNRREGREGEEDYSSLAIFPQMHQAYRGSTPRFTALPSLSVESQCPGDVKDGADGSHLRRRVDVHIPSVNSYKTNTGEESKVYNKSSLPGINHSSQSSNLSLMPSSSLHIVGGMPSYVPHKPIGTRNK